MKKNIFTLSSLRDNCLITKSGCWLWLGYLEDGYARARHNGKKTLLHRVSYELVNGQIADNLEVDHLCRNRSCLNPDHLEAVTHKENVLRGVSFSAENSKKKFCVNGHPLSGNNLVVYSDGARRCKTCLKIGRIEANYRFRHKDV